MKKQIISLGKDTITYGVGTVITKSISLLLLPLFTSFLSPEEYGVLAMLAILTMVAQPVFSLGISAAMGPSYFEGNNLETKTKTVWTSFILNLTSATLLMLIAWIFPSALGKLIRLPEESQLLISLSLTGCAFLIISTSLTQRVQFEKQVRLYVIVTVLSAIIAILTSVLAVVFFQWGAMGVVIGQLTGNIVTFLAFFLIALKATKPISSLSMSKNLLSLGLPLVPSFAFLFVLMHSNKYILEWQSGLEAVGLYSIGFNIGMTISIVTSGFSSAWYPFFMGYIDRQDDARVIFGKIFTYYVFAAGLLCFFYFVAAKHLISLLTQTPFHEAYIVVGPVSMAFVLQSVFSLFLPGVYFNKEVKYVAFIQGLAAVLSIPFNYFFIQNFGLAGAGIGLVVGNLLMAVFMYAWNVINHDRYPEIDYEWSRVLLFILLVVPMMFLYFCLSQIFMSGQVIISIVFGATMIVLSFLFLTKVERSFIIHIFHIR